MSKKKLSDSEERIQELEDLYLFLRNQLITLEFNCLPMKAGTLYFSGMKTIVIMLLLFITTLILIRRLF